MNGARRIQGVTLVELLVAMTLLAMLALAATELLAGLLSSQRTEAAEIGQDPEAQRVLDRMAECVAHTTALAIPNGRCRSTPRLALSGRLDNDGDGRIDEDPSATLFGGQVPGLEADCGCAVTTGGAEDDDGDGLVNEDPRDGIDNDADGSIDEDPSADANGDGAPGTLARDDDRDGQIDEGSAEDDDEDGHVNEDGPDLQQFYLQSDTHKLYEERPGAGTFVVLENVEAFQASYIPGAGEPVVELMLRVRSSDSPQALVLTTRVYPSNLIAHHGLTIP